MKHAIWTLGIALLATLPLAGADPIPCSADCEVQGGAQAFVPPVLAISNGADVHWVSSDGGGHANAANFNDPCIVPDLVQFSDGSPSADVTFNIVGSTLETTVSNVTETCTGAIQLPDGSFAIAYFCVLHPQMKGSIVVVND